MVLRWPCTLVCFYFFICLHYKFVYMASKLFEIHDSPYSLQSCVAISLVVDKSRILAGERAFSTAASCLWNSLPIKNAVPCFKKGRKTHLFSKPGLEITQGTHSNRHDAMCFCCVALCKVPIQIDIFLTECLLPEENYCALQD